MSDPDLLSAAEPMGHIGPEHAGDSPLAGAPPKRWARYDFLHAHRISPDQLRLLDRIMDRMARLAGKSLSQFLRTKVVARPAVVAEVSFSEWMENLPEAVVLVVFSCRHEAERGAWCVPNDLAAAFLDAMTGGTCGTVEPKQRFTDLEGSWLLRAGREVLAAVGEAWGPQSDAAMTPVEVTTAVGGLDLGVESDQILLTGLELALRGVQGHTMLALRASLVRDWLELAATSRRTTFLAPDAPTRERLDAQMHHTRVPVSARLASTLMPLAAVTALRPGDVLRLDARKDQPVQVQVGAAVKFVGWPGSHRGRVAVKLAKGDRG